MYKTPTQTKQRTYARHRYHLSHIKARLKLLSSRQVIGVRDPRAQPQQTSDAQQMNPNGVLPPMKFTKIAGKYYDLTTFRHPGGDTALWHAFGRDATVLFKSHHPFVSQQKLAAILSRYEVAKLPEMVTLLPGEEDVPQFSYDTQFSREVKREVQNYFETQVLDRGVPLLVATKATTSRWLQLAVLSCIRLVCFWQWACGHVIGLLSYPVATWLAGSNSFHDACHFALSSNQTVNKLVGYTYPTLTSPFTWYHQHNIGHHAYTNVTNKDPDLYHIAYLQRTIPTTEYRGNYAYQKFTVWIGWVVSYLGLVIMPNVKSFLNGTYFKIVPIQEDAATLHAFEIAHILGGVCVSLLPFVLFTNFQKACLFSVVPYLVHSVLFMMNSQITHLHTPCMVHEKDWYKHQVLTATNHGMGDWFNFIFSGGLNYQIEHHIFPNINHCHHPYIHPIVKRICAKHGVEYKEFNGFRDAFASYYNHVVLMGKQNPE
jgi:delta11-fatty-acid desaturase